MAEHYPGTRTVTVPAWTTKQIEVTWAPGGEVLTPRDRQRLSGGDVQNRLVIRELAQGLEIETYSYVGIFPLDRFTLHITPRIAFHDLIRMINYCFDIAPIHVLPDAGQVPSVAEFPFELLIRAFIREVRRLLSKGLLRQYVELEDDLLTKKGRIAFGNLARRPRTSALLPCRYEERTQDIFLNRLLLSVIHQAVTMVTSRSLGYEVLRTKEQMAELCGETTLTPDAFDTAIRGLDRLSNGYKKALELARLVHDCVCPDNGDSLPRLSNGFLLNMNKVFELFVGNLLAEFRPTDTSIVCQNPFSKLYATDGGGFRNPRPDFMLSDPNGTITHVIDAKYKFLDEREADPSDLYQLTIYALATQSKRAVALYPGSRASRSYQFRGHDCHAKVIFRALDLGDVWKVLDAQDRRARGQELVSRLLNQ